MYGKYNRLHKIQLVIPKKVCQNLDICSNQKMQLIGEDNRVVLIPIRPNREARSSLKGIETTLSGKMIGHEHR